MTLQQLIEQAKQEHEALHQPCPLCDEPTVVPYTTEKGNVICMTCGATFDRSSK